MNVDLTCGCVTKAHQNPNGFAVWEFVRVCPEHTKKASKQDVERLFEASQQSLAAYEAAGAIPRRAGGGGVGGNGGRMVHECNECKAVPCDCDDRIWGYWFRFNRPPETVAEEVRYTPVPSWQGGMRRAYAKEHRENTITRWKVDVSPVQRRSDPAPRFNLEDLQPGAKRDEAAAKKTGTLTFTEPPVDKPGAQDDAARMRVSRVRCVWWTSEKPKLRERAIAIAKLVFPQAPWPKPKDKEDK